MELPNLNSRLRRLPRPARRVARRALDRTGWRPRQRYRFEADGLATVHFSPFAEDPAFSALYREMASEWFVESAVDVRWRMWLLTTFARQCGRLEGNFAEFGVYRAGCAFMILSLTEASDHREMFLFDTFAGIPDNRLSERERALGLAGLLEDTSVDYVQRRLAPFAGRFRICAGDVFDTLQKVETGPLALAHVDLNATGPTTRALEYVYPRLQRGAIVVFDDYGYGWENSAQERAAIDAYLADKPEFVVALPTGQGFAIKQNPPERAS